MIHTGRPMHRSRWTCRAIRTVDTRLDVIIQVAIRQLGVEWENAILSIQQFDGTRLAVDA
jgi:hypothetical protein